MNAPCGGSTIVWFPHFDLVYIPWAGLVITLYPDGSHSLSGITLSEEARIVGNPDDREHAERITATGVPITEGEHRLLHEFLHHAIALECGYRGGSPIAWRSAQRMLPEKQPQPESENEERAVRAVLYTAFGPWDDLAPLESLKRLGVPIPALQEGLRNLLTLSRHNENGLTVDVHELMYPERAALKSQLSG